MGSRWSDRGGRGTYRRKRHMAQAQTAEKSGAASALEADVKPSRSIRINVHGDGVWLSLTKPGEILAGVAWASNHGSQAAISGDTALRLGCFTEKQMVPIIRETDREPVLASRIRIFLGATATAWVPAQDARPALLAACNAVTRSVGGAGP